MLGFPHGSLPLLAARMRPNTGEHVCGRYELVRLVMQARARNNLEELFAEMKPHFTRHEWQQVNACGSGDKNKEACINRLWSLKEAFTKACGVGIAFGLHRCEFTLHAAADEPDHWTASLKVEGQPMPNWSFHVQPLPNDHWVAVARGPHTDAAVEVTGKFKATFGLHLDDEALRRELAQGEPLFDFQSLCNLLPPDESDEIYLQV